jgi:hypothetical protein
LPAALIVQGDGNRLLKKTRLGAKNLAVPASLILSGEFS